MPLGPADDGVDTRNQFFAVEGFSEIIVSTKAKTLKLAFRVIIP